MGERVLDAEHAAPRAAVEDEVIEAEAFADLLDLLAIAVDRPERRIIGMIGVPDAELVVVVELHAMLRQKIFEAFEVIVWNPGPPCSVSIFTGPWPTRLVQTWYLPSTSINFAPPVLTSADELLTATTMSADIIRSFRMTMVRTTLAIGSMAQLEAGMRD